jgi:hypothetical protein
MLAALSMRSRIKNSMCADSVNTFNGTGSNSIKESEQGEFDERLRAEAISGFSLTRLNSFILGHEAVAHNADAQLETVMVDRQVDVKLTDIDSESEATVRFVIGGEDEPQLYTHQGIQVISYESPVGKKLIGKPVGFEFSLKRGGIEHDAVITSINRTPEPDAVLEVGSEQAVLPLKAVAA